MSDDTRARQKALRDAVVGVWVAAFASIAVAAISVPRSPQPHGALVATTLVFVLGVLVTARRAAARGGALAVVSTGIVAAGGIPALVCLSIYAATRPIVACYALDCRADLNVALIIGGVSTLVPLAGTTALASVLTTLRGRGHGHVVALATIVLALASALAVIATARAFRVPTVDRYVETVGVVGTVPGARLGRYYTPAPPHPPPQLFGAQWSFVDGPNPCHLSIGGGGYDIAAVRPRPPSDAPPAAEVECPEVRIRHDDRRSLVVVDEPTENGGFTPAFVVSTATHTSGPLYPHRYDLGDDVAAPRPWIVMAAAAVVAALALVLRRLLTERHDRATWRAARLGTHRGDGWVAFDDDAEPPIHLASAVALPAGPVHVIGAATRAPDGAADYRSAGPRAADGVVAGDLAAMTALSQDRMKSTIVIAATMAVAATVPLAASMFILTLD